MFQSGPTERPVISRATPIAWLKFFFAADLSGTPLKTLKSLWDVLLTYWGHLQSFISFQNLLWIFWEFKSQDLIIKGFHASATIPTWNHMRTFFPLQSVSFQYQSCFFSLTPPGAARPSAALLSLDWTEQSKLCPPSSSFFLMCSAPSQQLHYISLHNTYSLKMWLFILNFLVNSLGHFSSQSTSWET